MKQSKAFTMIEAIIVMTVLVVFTYGIGSFIFTATRSWTQIADREPSLDNARLAMNRMLLELRRIKKPQNILVSATSECQFLDLDSQTIDFKQTGTNLMRNTDVLALGLSSPQGLTFTYFDANGTPTGVKKDIRSIRIWLSFSGSNQALTLESSARIRNL